MFQERTLNFGKGTFMRLLIALFAASSVFASYNMPMGVTPISHKIYDLHMLMFYACCIVGILTFSVMFYALLKHRKSLGVTPSKSSGNMTLEILWTVIPLIILLALAYPAALVMIEMQERKDADVNVLVRGIQWKWQYEYLDHGFSLYSNLDTPMAQREGTEPKGKNYLLEVDEPLVVPIHKNIRFLFTSRDVNHSWWVPDFGFKVDCIPGYINEGWAYIEKPGTYRGQCTELCGILHGFMPVVVEAKTEEEYNKWLASKMDITLKKKENRVFTMDESMKLGKRVYTQHCQACHQENGMGMPPAIPAMVGGRITTGDVSGHIDVLLNGIKGSAMQSFADQLNDEEIAAVITYERNAWGNGDKEKYGPKAGGLIQPVLIERAREGKPLAEPTQVPMPDAKKEKKAMPAMIKDMKQPEVKPVAVKEKKVPAASEADDWSLDIAMKLGKSIYQRNCQACHQANGMGMPPVIPAMVGGKITTGPVEGHIHVLLHGIKGSAMQSFNWLTDQEIAAVVTYERNDWGNDNVDAYGEHAGGLVMPADVKSMREGN